MAKDDINVIMYKILKYLYTCMKAGVKPVPEEMISFLDIPELYWEDVILGLVEKGFINDIQKRTTTDGLIITLGERFGISIDGMRFMDSDSKMEEVDEFLGESFGIVLDNSIALQK